MEKEQKKGMTFLIGNGFDLQQGLKTAYSDFEKYYSKRNKDIGVKEFIKRVSKQNMWADLELALGNITNCYGPDAKEEYEICVNNLRHKLALYLKRQSKKFKYKISRDKKVAKESLQNWFREGGGVSISV